MALALVITASVLIFALILTPTVFQAFGHLGWRWNSKDMEWEPIYWFYVRPPQDRLNDTMLIGSTPICLIADQETIAAKAEAAFAALAPWQLPIAYIEARYRIAAKQIPRFVLAL